MTDDAAPDSDRAPDERDRRSAEENGDREVGEATEGDAATTDETARTDRSGPGDPSETVETSAESNVEDAAGASARAPDDGNSDSDSEREREGGSEGEAAEDSTESEIPDAPDERERDGIPDDVRRYERFKKIEGASYERANGFLRDRTHITAREWAIARLCTDFRTATGVEMTKIGENLPRLVPFMTDTYSPQAVNQARASFEEKIRKAGATFLYGAMSDFFTAEELDDVMYEATEVAKFLLEVEGADLAVEAELAAEDRIQSAMREVHRQSAALRHDVVECPHCGGEFEPDAEATEPSASENDDAPL